MLDHEKIARLGRHASAGVVSAPSTAALLAMGAGAVVGGALGSFALNSFTGLLFGGASGALLGLALLPDSKI